jgi:hypothetical protein
VPPEVGDPVVHLARYDEAPSFGLSQCDVCVIEHVTIHASPGASVVATQSDATAQCTHSRCIPCTLLTGVRCTGVCAALVRCRSDALLVRNVTVEPIPGRYHTTNADGVFVLEARVGPTITSSRLLAIGDDGSATERSNSGVELASRIFSRPMFAPPF